MSENILWLIICGISSGGAAVITILVCDLFAIKMTVKDPVCVILEKENRR
jgi:hypothetical protein